MVEVLAVVPARGGSKGVPRKNLREVAGRTLVARAVDAAREATLVNRVVGTTDDAEIADAMRAAGAEVPDLRPADLSGDDVGDGPVFLHVLDVLACGGYRPDIVVNVRPTAPLRTPADIDRAIQMLLDHPSARSVKCVVEVGDHPHKMWTLRDDGMVEPLLPEWRAAFGGDPDVARQRLPTVYRSSGAVDVVWVNTLREAGYFHPGPVAAVVLDPRHDVDIDTEGDLALAESILRKDQA